MPTTVNSTYEHPRVQFSWAGRSDVGHRRAVNEDNYVCAPGIFVVADGMGGHAAGDVASQAVIDSVSEWRERGPIAFADIERFVYELNLSVRSIAEETGQAGMGTTLVGVVWAVQGQDDFLVVVNVGDSRCYVATDDELRSLTHDHSLVQDLVDAGRISPAEARYHPDRNVVTRAIGVSPGVVADYVLLSATGRLRLLLCSDGVSGHLEESVIAEALHSSNTPQVAVDAILEAVLDGAAPDNATAVVIDVDWQDQNAAPDIDITGPRIVAQSDVDEDTLPRGSNESADNS